MITSEILKQHNLNEEEYQKILQILGREPNLVELGVFSVMWSEHCSYKSSRKFLKNLPTTGPQVIQGPGENAGIVDIGDGWGVAFKMESHNHPSFIEPMNGAATGVGGILRDVFTMGARPFAILDSLRFGSPKNPKTPFLVNGVVAGIAHYGNCVGVPTVGGEVYFDECYNGNILVNAMTAGLVRHEKIFKGIAKGPGNPVFYIGSKTGRDGIHGATMASDSFDENAESKKPTVQVGDPFTEKLLLEACLELMENDVILGIQDMGAAGLTSSSVEMAARAGNGLLLELDRIPVREEGMTPYEILLSESQERMLLVAKKGGEEKIREVLKKWDLDCAEIGQVTDDGFWRARFHGEEVARLPVKPLAGQAPIYDRPRIKPKDFVSNQILDLTNIPCPPNLSDTLKTIIKHPEIASKKWIYSQYDHQVMTQSSILPGSDSAVISLHGMKKGIALTTNCNSRYCYLDPVMGTIIAVAESARNLAVSGARPLALTDCLNFGNPENPEIMWQFEQSLEGMRRACLEFSIPVVSGNVSFYNETNGVSIYPTPIIGMVGLLEEMDHRCDSFFKNEGDLILLFGEHTAEIGGSAYLKIIYEMVKGIPPRLDFEKEKRLMNLLGEITSHKLANSLHDLSEGGLAVNLLESCFGPKTFGVEVTLTDSLAPDHLLFGEGQSRVIGSIDPQLKARVVSLAQKQGVPCQVIGHVVKERIVIGRKNETPWIDLSAKELKRLWEKGFAGGVFNC